MNKFQRRESKAVRRTISYCPIRLQMDANYKAVRRRLRKTARLMLKTNQKAHEEAPSKAVNDSTHQDLCDTVCVAEAIKFKLVGFNCRHYGNHIEVTK